MAKTIEPRNEKLSRRHRSDLISLTDKQMKYIMHKVIELRNKRLVTYSLRHRGNLMLITNEEVDAFIRKLLPENMKAFRYMIYFDREQKEQVIKMIFPFKQKELYGLMIPFGKDHDYAFYYDALSDSLGALASPGKLINSSKGGFKYINLDWKKLINKMKPIALPYDIEIYDVTENELIYYTA